MKRLGWADSIKATGIFLVIIGHSKVVPNEVKNWIYSYHMPLFFFISGYFFDISKNIEWKKFIKNKSRSLLRPYLVISLCMCICINLMKIIIKKSISAKLIINQIIGIFIQIPGTEFKSSYWFFTCLFFCEVIYLFIVKISKKSLIKIGIYSLLFSIIGYVISIIIGNGIPWHLDVALMMQLIFFLGTVVNKINIFEKLTCIKGLVIAMFFMVANIILYSINLNISNVRVDLNRSQIGNFIIFYLAASMGVISIVLAFYKLSTPKVFKFVGENSGLYYMLDGIGISFVNLISEVIGININTWIGLLLQLIGAWIITIPIVMVLNNYFGVFIGKKTYFINNNERMI